MRTRTSIALTLVVALIMGLAAPALAGAPPAPFFNGFENAGDVGDANTMDTVTRVTSGTNGVASADGGWHAVVQPTDFGVPDGFVFTRYGGYGTEFPDGGYTTSIDIYLDTAHSPDDTSVRLDWSSAISTPAGDHRRDFIFSVGRDGSGGYVMSASNNAPGWPGNPGRSPYTISTTGWYTFQHTFYDAGGGVLAVDMSVIDSSGTVLNTWTLSNPSDIIGTTVGGNRYGWMVTNDFPDLPIDNIVRTGSSLQDQKQAVLDDLAALLPTGDDKDDKELEKAIEKLEKSLDPELWADGDTLADKDGKKVFDEESKTVKHLGKVENTDLSGAIAALVDIDAGLAQGAIDAAWAAYDAADCDVTMTKDCEKAAKELDKAAEAMAKAAEELTEGDSDKAIKEYKKAWEKAQKALDKLA